MDEPSSSSSSTAREQRGYPKIDKPMDTAGTSIPATGANDAARSSTGQAEATGTSFHLFGNFFHNELFHDSQLEDKPFWKAKFFVTEPTLFGTWDGVYTSCLIHLFGIITLLRAGWIVGNAGIILSVCIVLLSLGISSIAVLAGIKIIERVGGGTVHYCLSQVLGTRLGGAISLVYCFGASVNCALHVVGFTESMLMVLQNTEPWAERTISGVVIFILFLINFAGVKWVVRLQFLILAILLGAAVDLSVGLFITRNSGIIGFSKQNFLRNLHPDNLNSLFAVFGVFFPAVTGVFTGVNMSNDLYRPEESIYKGTFASIATALILYLLFMVGLGSVCDRSALLHDDMIAVKVSALGHIITAAIYVSSLSFSLSSMYAVPRIIQDMATERIIPGISILAKGYGPNKSPVFALITYALITLLFAMLPNFNMLATMVTIPTLMTFAWIEYAHFSLSVNTEVQMMRDERFARRFPMATSSTLGKSTSSRLTEYGSLVRGSLDRLFTGSLKRSSASSVAQEPKIHEKIYIRRENSSPEISDSSLVSPDEHSSMKSMTGIDDSSTDRSAQDPGSVRKSKPKFAHNHPELNEEWNRAINGVISNRIVSLFGAILKVILMFLVHWLYSLISISITLLLWLYIGYVSPGVQPGVSQITIFKYYANKMRKFFRKDSEEYHQFVVTTDPDMGTTAAQLTQEGTDFSARQRFHQKTITTTEISTDSAYNASADISEVFAES
ncbi:solute carrier family 12 member 8 isoform X2 [Brevipalpus obovatus]|uniref:solute carrier family 12 member 8 isoform X2 n=1 Tax=Brevipalpus obovatus TaxID=246614 RepID=UPI003D9EACB0